MKSCGAYELHAAPTYSRSLICSSCIYLGGVARRLPFGLRPVMMFYLRAAVIGQVSVHQIVGSDLVPHPLLSIHSWTTNYSHDTNKDELICTHTSPSRLL